MWRNLPCSNILQDTEEKTKFYYIIVLLTSKVSEKCYISVMEYDITSVDTVN